MRRLYGNQRIATFHKLPYGRGAENYRDNHEADPEHTGGGRFKEMSIKWQHALAECGGQEDAQIDQRRWDVYARMVFSGYHHMGIILRVEGIPSYPTYRGGRWVKG